MWQRLIGGGGCCDGGGGGGGGLQERTARYKEVVAMLAQFVDGLKLAEPRSWFA